MTRPLQPRSNKRRAQERALERAVEKRDGWTCQFERRIGRFWSLCVCYGADKAHIEPRANCGKAVLHPDVVLRACRRCHDAFDGRDNPDDLEVRVPPARARQAHKTILKNSKVRPRAWRAKEQ